MSKKSGILKWISRLIGYDYVNPDDGGKGDSLPQSRNNDGGHNKPLEEDIPESPPLDHDKDPRTRKATSDAE